AAGEDVFAQPRVGRARRRRAADRVEQGDSVVGQQLLHLAEERAVVARADMLEHADRDDAVVAAGLLAIVAGGEARALGATDRRGAVVRNIELLARQRDAGDVRLADGGEIEPKPAPARTDVEDLHAGPEQQLRGEMTLLVVLRLVERLVVVGE